MNSRDRTIWVFLIFLAIISIGSAAINLIPANKKWNQALKRANAVQFGTDEELENVIEFLEQRLEERNSFHFAIDKEPLRLTNVLYLTDAQGRLLRYRNRNKLRITHIINGSTQYAGIQFDGDNYTVVVGDSIAGGEVVWIDADEVVIVKGDTEFHYSVSGLSDEENVTMQNNSRSEF